MLSRSNGERQRNLMIYDQRPLPVYFSQLIASANYRPYNVVRHSKQYMHNTLDRTPLGAVPKQ